MVQVEEHVRLDKPSSKPGSELGKNLILLTMLQNHENKTVEMVGPAVLTLISSALLKIRLIEDGLNNEPRSCRARLNRTGRGGWRRWRRASPRTPRRRSTKSGTVRKCRPSIRTRRRRPTSCRWRRPTLSTSSARWPTVLDAFFLFTFT